MSRERRDRVMAKTEVIDLCRARLQEMDTEGFWGAAMKDEPAPVKCAWMLRYLHVQIRLQCCTFNLEDALGWVDEIVSGQGGR
jgi:hypothetical protein